MDELSKEKQGNEANTLLAVGYSIDLHAKYTRLDRLKCWLKYGHTLPKFGSDAMVWQCQRCGKVLYATYR